VISALTVLTLVVVTTSAWAMRKLALMATPIEAEERPSRG
jgi:hypothetical protein